MRRNERSMRTTVTPARLLVLSLCAFGIAIGTARAVDPVPDWKTLIMPTLLPKAGHGPVPPGDAQPGDIRNSYDATYENYWKETSYFSYNPATGAKIRGYYNDTKTYGYTRLPWPIKPRVDLVEAAGPIGSGDRFVTSNNVNPAVVPPEEIQDGNRMFSDNVVYVPDAADEDGVWTPGESFNDVNGNGQWDDLVPPVPPVPQVDGESYWNANNAASDGVPLGLHSILGAVWDPDRGEFFADYNYNSSPGNGVLGYDPDVLIWVADLGAGMNIPLHINELDLINPSGITMMFRGDFAHTYSDQSVTPPLKGLPPEGVVIAANGLFDYTETGAGVPQIHIAVNQQGTPVTISYQSYRYITLDPIPPDPYPPIYTNAVAVLPGDPLSTFVQPVTITVPIIQTGELFVGLRRAGAGWQAFGDNGSAFMVQADDTVTPLVPEVPEVPEVPAEPFEDFISWNGNWVTNIVDPYSGIENPRERETPSISSAEYDRYIMWNYPGNALAKADLVARAGNGVYDGPEKWTELVNNKVIPDPANPAVMVDGKPILALEPGNGHWDGRDYADWAAWWNAAFGARLVLNPANGHYYQVETEPATWVAANLTATMRGGYLVQVDDAAENTFVGELVEGLDSWTDPAVAGYPTGAVWIGASDQAVEGTWRWTDGSLLWGSAWWAGQPDDAAPGEDYAAMVDATYGYAWFDFAADTMITYVIEYDYLPVLPSAPAPAWPGIIPNYIDYVPSALPASGWIPVDSWGYDSPREYCDLPSSMYHIGGSPLGAMRLVKVPDPTNKTVNIVGISGGDNAMGEMTSPWTDDLWGEDLWPESDTGADPSGPDWSVPSCGPLAYNINGQNGYDAGNLVTLEWITRKTDGDPVTETYPKWFRDTNLDGVMDLGVCRTGDPHYSTDKHGKTGGDGAGPYPYNRERFMEDCVEAWDQSEDFGAFRSHITGGRVPLYAYPIYPPSAGDPGWAGLGGPAGANVTVLTRDEPTGRRIFFQVRPIDANAEGNAPIGATTGYGMGLLCHEQGHDIQGWPDLYDYDVWSVEPGEQLLNSPIAGYDLMAGGLVHGVADLKNSAGWINLADLTTVVPLGERLVLPMYPVEDFADQYYRLVNPSNTMESLDFWYTANSTQFGPPGGAGVYVSHTDLYSDGNALPRQQRVNNHFVWEMVQADGRSDLEDRVNGGDTGDPFPGTADLHVYSGDTDPAARWWDQSDIGLRIVDIQVPPAPGLPALVTFERYAVTNKWMWPETGADIDADGLPDVWEYHYFGNLVTADALTDSDFDGLSDLGEYLAQTDPMNATVSTDASDDGDGDAVPNIDEFIVYGSDPSLPDTDDDGIPDAEEILEHTSPTNSLSPLLGRVLSVTGDVNACVDMPDEPLNSRFELPQWTIETWIKPSAAPVGQEAILIARQFPGDGRYNYCLSLATNRILVARFSPGDRTADIEVRSPLASPISTGVWTHVSATFISTTGVLRCYINAVIKGQTATTRRPTTVGLGDPATVIGKGFNGSMDEVHVWSAYPGDRTLIQLRGVLTNLPVGMVSYLRFDDSTNPDGTSGLIGLDRGQVEDFTRTHDWNGRWQHAGTLMGGAAIVPNDVDGPGTPPAPDSDLDGLPDWWENQYFPGQNAVTSQDPDADGLNNLGEFQNGTDPWNPDTDGDGMPDGWEVTNHLLPTINDALMDPDGDHMDNYSEYVAGTNPNDAGSVLAITGLQAGASGVSIGWKGGTTALQYLQTSVKLTGSDMVWTSVLTSQPPTAVNGAYLHSGNTNLIRFYRIKAAKP